MAVGWVDPGAVADWVTILVFAGTVLAVLYTLLTGKLPRLAGEHIRWQTEDEGVMTLPEFSEAVYEAQQEACRERREIKRLSRRNAEKLDAALAAVLDLTEVVDGDHMDIDRMQDEFYPDRRRPGDFHTNGGEDQGRDADGTGDGGPSPPDDAPEEG